MSRNPNCADCPLHSGVITRCIYGRKVGPGPYDLMVVGSGPSWNEDRQGYTFVGPPADLLTEALTKAGIRSYYLTTVVKCRVVGDPKRDAVKACAKYLDEEIADIKPRYVLALGNPALQRINGKGKITELSGTEIDSGRYKGIKVFPALAPGYIMNAAGKRPSWEADMMRLGRLLKGEVLEKAPVEVDILEYAHDIPWLEERINDHCAAGLPLSYDIEGTYGLDWWHRDYRVFSVSFGFSKRESVVLPLAHPDSPFRDLDPRKIFGRFRRALEGGFGNELVAHNSMYDDLGIYRISGYIPRVTFDTMTTWQLIDENSPKGLKWLIATLLGWPDYGIDTRLIPQTPLREVAFYNGCDTSGTLGVMEAEIERLASMPRVEAYRKRVVAAYTPVLERMVSRGVYINPETLSKRLTICREKKAEAKALIPVDNPGSTKQIAKWFYSPKSEGGLGLPVVKLTPEKNPSTDEDVVWTLARQEKRILPLLDYRGYDKNETTYFAKWEEATANSFDGLWHYELRIGKTDTGRLASESHTTPRDPFVRNCVDAPPRDHPVFTISGGEQDEWVLLCADSKNIEARLAAWTALMFPTEWDRVPKNSMLWAFHSGQDPYVLTAAQALNKRPEDVDCDRSNPMNERQIMGKVPTLACIYKISPQGLQEYAWTEFQIDWDLPTATRLHTAFYTRFPEFSKWHNREEIIIKNRGWTASVLGRVRRLPNAKSQDKRLAMEDIRTGINMPVQNLASDIVQAAHTLLDTKMRPDRFFSVITVHDSIEFYVRRSWLERVKKAITYAMNEGAVKYLAPLGLQLPPGLLGCDFEEGAWGGVWRNGVA